MGTQVSGSQADPLAKPPRIVLRFAIYTAIALLVACGGMLWYLRKTMTDRAESESAVHTSLVARTILRTDLRPSDFAGPVRGARLAALDRLFAMEVLGGSDLRVKLYRRDGLVTYSNDHGLIGTKPDNPELRDVLGGETLRDVSSLNHEGGSGPDVRVLETYTPVVLAGRTAIGAFERYESYGPVSAEAWSTAKPIAIVLALTMLALYVFFFPILRRLTATLKLHYIRLQEQTRALERTLAEREQAQKALSRSEEQLRQAQKMEAVGQLAGGVAHDFNNHMTAVRGFGELVLGQLEHDDPLRDDVEQIVRAGEQASAMTKQLLAFSRKQVLQPRVLDLNDVVRDSEKLLRRLIGEHIELRSDLERDLAPVEADQTQLEQVLVNLVVNARDAMPKGGKLTISTRNAGARVRLTVADTGVGMDAETQAHVFEPFFTTKGEGRGTGLGLSTVYGIVKQSGGDVSLESAPGAGTTIVVELPRMHRRSEARTDFAGALALERGNETILLVEDDELVRRFELAVLEQCGYTVLAAANPLEALELAEAYPGTIDLLLTDVVMPDLGGRELAERLARTRPTTKVLYASGYADDAVIRHGVLRSEVAFLAKPVMPAALAAKVRDVLGPVRVSV